MAKYKVLEKSFIGNRLVEAGEIVEYEGAPAENLEPVKEESDTKSKAKSQKTSEDLV